MQNTTIEERVALLELQVAGLEENVVDLDEDVDFLFDEQVIQDERLLNLEVTSAETKEDIVSMCLLRHLRIMLLKLSVSKIYRTRIGAMLMSQENIRWLKSIQAHEYFEVKYFCE